MKVERMSQMQIATIKTTGEHILKISDLEVRFPIRGGVFQRKIAEVRAVDGISLDSPRGEVLGLVGESGCGKSTVGKAILNVLKVTAPDVEVAGDIYLATGEGYVNLNAVSRQRAKEFRSEIQMIFQDPFSSLNPRMIVRQIIQEPLDIHTSLSRNEKREKVDWLMERVGLSGEQASRYPHEFSGGQRQRIGIARALATNPRLIIADEPVSALDVSIQAQVINLMMDLQEEFDLSYLFIAHDLSIVEHISTRIAVMYLGDIVEIGGSDQVYRNPLHPYSKALISAVPLPDPSGARKKRILLNGEVPSPTNKPSGCGFRTRCPVARPECSHHKPLLEGRGDAHPVACPYA